MTPDDLRNEINIELTSLDIIVREIVSLRNDLGSGEPTIREKTAAAGFLAQFYNGVENILKRIGVFQGRLPLESGSWLLELFKQFSPSTSEPFPSLFDDQLTKDLVPYRKFRHIARHGYTFELEWDRMREGVENVEVVFSRFKRLLFDYLKTM